MPRLPGHWDDADSRAGSNKRVRKGSVARDNRDGQIVAAGDIAQPPRVIAPRRSLRQDKDPANIGIAVEYPLSAAIYKHIYRGLWEPPPQRPQQGRRKEHIADLTRDYDENGAWMPMSHESLWHNAGRRTFGPVFAESLTGPDLRRVQAHRETLLVAPKMGARILAVP